MRRKILAIIFLAGLGVIVQAEPQAWMSSIIQPFDCGQTIQIQAVPNEGYQFVKWEDGDVHNPRVIEVKEATSGLYRAQFAEKTPTGIDDVTVSPKAIKLIINDKLYIQQGDKLYDATGKRVR